MPDRKRLTTFWLTSSLALLASVLIGPARTSGFVAESSRPDCLRRTFAPSPGQPSTRISAATTRDVVLQVNALPAEIEEQDPADYLGESGVSFVIPCSFRKVSDRQFIAPRSILSHYPLRC